jgi:hypothetical protein
MTDDMEPIFIGSFNLDMRLRTFPSTEKVQAIHVDFHDDEYPDCLLLLTENKFYGKDSLVVELTDDDLREINNRLKAASTEDPSITNWEYMCRDWNKCTPYDKIEFPKEQPNYLKTKEVVE